MKDIENNPIPDLVISVTDRGYEQSSSPSRAKNSANKPDRLRPKKNESQSKVSLRVNLPVQINDRNFDPYAVYTGPGGRIVQDNRDHEVEAWRDNAELGSDDELLSIQLHDVVTAEQIRKSGEASVR